jgi:hypothetical protein
MKYDQKRLFEVMGRLDKTFKPKAELLTEWNFDKKKGEDKDEEKDETKKHEESETPAEEKAEEKHEESETPEEEKAEDKGKKALKEADKPAAKIPVNAIAKVGGK